MNRIAPPLFAAVLGMATALPGAETAVWQTNLRTETRAGYDTNLFLQDEAPLAPGQTQRATPVRAGAAEWIFGAGATARRQPAGADGTKVEAEGSLTWHRFEGWAGEAHRDLRLRLGARRVAGGLVAEARATLLDVAGGDTGPVYNAAGGTPSIGAEPVRARRAQGVGTLFIAIGRAPEGGAWGWRAHATASHQDFRTRYRSEPYGAANFLDRGQALVGLDLGRKLAPTTTLWATLRGGRQWQANPPGKRENATNSVLRPGLGLEETVTSAWRFSAWAGPDLRRFTGARCTGVARDRAMPFYEVQATWMPGPRDTVTAAARQTISLSGAGRSAYRDTSGELAWSRRAGARLEHAVRLARYEADFGGFATTPRHDLINTAALTAGWRATRRWTLEVGLTREWTQTRIPATAGRSYERWVGRGGWVSTW